MSKLYLIDGMSVVFRAYHAMLRSQLKAPSGELTFAVFAFANILTSLLEKEKPERIAVVFDTREPTFRHIMYPEYKANREEFPEDLVPQLARIKELIGYLKIPQVEMHGFEADDIIGTYSKLASDEGNEVICLTSDKDFYQLVNDHVKLYKPSRKSNEDFEIVHYEEVLDKFGVKPEQVIDVQALIGDSVDNVPGVKGIGEKTAIPLIQKYGSLENLYEHLDEIERAAVKSKLEKDREMAFLSKKLVTIKLDVPVTEKWNDLNWKEPDYYALDEFFSVMGFNTIRRKWRERSGIENFSEKKEEYAEEHGMKEPEKKLDDITTVYRDYNLVNTQELLDSMIDELKGSEVLSVDLETSSLDKSTCAIVGIALCAKENRAFYVAVDGPVPEEKGKSGNHDNQGSLFDSSDGNDENDSFNFKYLDIYEVTGKLKPLLENEKTGKCGQNLKFDAYILKRYGIRLSPVVFDSMLASYILNPDDRHNLDALSKKWLSYTPVPITTLIGEKKKGQISMKQVDPAKISDYACEDADLAFKLRNVLKSELEKDKELVSLAEDIEFPVSEVLTKMEFNGVAVDTEALKDMSAQMTKKAAELTDDIYKEAGTEFNIDSPKQLGHVLFEKMQIPPVKKTKTGYSTDVQVLTQLSDIYPIADMILNYRTIVKLKSTYIDTLPKLINPYTGRIHTTFNQTVASTGRLSSTDPNLQNIPIRTELGKEIRKAFVPGKKGRLILSADYSQVELRIMAYICGDSHLIDAFKKGHDIHSATASKLFGKAIEEVDSDMRRVAKTVNFGIMYGLGSFGLSQRLKIGRKEASEIIDNYFEKYPGIRQYIDMTTESAREKGYAATLAGRRRYFKDINAKNRNLRTAAERAAINMPIQGTASDIMKIAMINVDRKMKDLRMKSLMTIQVHDELVFDASPDEIDELQPLVKEEMENAFKLGDVPVVVETGIGDNWLDAH